MPTASSRALTRIPLAGVALLALADTAIVALALPPILAELGTDVPGVAAVLGVYAIVLAAALLPAERLGRVYGMRALGLAGVGLFALGSVVCGLAGEISLLLIARAVQALGGAALLVTAHAVLVGDRRSATGQSLVLWRQAVLLGTAAGPAIGGALTQAFGWRSIFLIQAPVALAAAYGCLGAPRADLAARRTARHAAAPGRARARLRRHRGGALPDRPPAGQRVEHRAARGRARGEPDAADRARGRPHPRPGRHACRRGRAAVAAGAAALAFLPTASVAWMILPEVAVGIGTGLALTALGGELLPDRNGHESARLLTVRHLGSRSPSSSSPRSRSTSWTPPCTTRASAAWR